MPRTAVAIKNDVVFAAQSDTDLAEYLCAAVRTLAATVLRLEQTVGDIERHLAYIVEAIPTREDDHDRLARIIGAA